MSELPDTSGDRRGEFLAKASEEGRSAEEIQSQLDAFDQQLKDIDKQIAQMTIQQTGQELDKVKKHDTQPKTKQEAENEKLADITKLSTGLDRAEVISSVKTQVDGDIGIRKSEIELEKSRGGDTKEMEEELAQLQGRAGQLTAGIQGQLNETLEDIEESRDHVDAAEKEQAADKTDGGAAKEAASITKRVEEDPARPGKYGDTDVLGHTSEEA